MDLARCVASGGFTGGSASGLAATARLHDFFAAANFLRFAALGSTGGLTGRGDVAGRFASGLAAEATRHGLAARRFLAAGLAGGSASGLAVGDIFDDRSFAGGGFTGRGASGLAAATEGELAGTNFLAARGTSGFAGGFSFDNFTGRGVASGLASRTAGAFETAELADTAARRTNGVASGFTGRVFNDRGFTGRSFTSSRLASRGAALRTLERTSFRSGADQQDGDCHQTNQTFHKNILRLTKRYQMSYTDSKNR